MSRDADENDSPRRVQLRHYLLGMHGAWLPSKRWNATGRSGGQSARQAGSRYYYAGLAVSVSRSHNRRAAQTRTGTVCLGLLHAGVVR